MNIPKKTSSPYRVCMILHRHGPSDFKKLLSIGRKIEFRITQRMIESLMESESITMDSHSVYTLAPDVTEHFRKIDLITPTSKQSTVFKPISSKNIPSMCARRDDAEPLRDIHLINGSSTSVPYRNL
jgi:hypothetical protein